MDIDTNLKDNNININININTNTNDNTNDNANADANVGIDSGMDLTAESLADETVGLTAKRKKKDYAPWSTEPTEIEVMIREFWNGIPRNIRIILIILFVGSVVGLIIAGIISTFGW